MAKGASARAAARRQKDKWKAKRWFSIRAPRNPWSFKTIGETLAEDEDMLIGRHYEIMQNELDGDFTKMHVKISFRVVEVIGNDAITEFIGHDVMKDHVRRQVRRDRGKIDDAIDVVTEDGFYVRIKPMMVTRSSVRGSQKQESRVIARNIIIKHCAKNTWISVQKSILDGSLEEEVGKAVSKIQPLRTVFFRRSQLIQTGVIIDDGPTLEDVIADEAASKEAPSKIESDELEALPEQPDEGPISTPDDSENISEDSQQDSDELEALPEQPDEGPISTPDDSENISEDSQQDSGEEEDKPQSDTETDSSDLSNLPQKLKPELVEISKNLDIDHSGTKNEIIERIYDSQNVTQLKELLKKMGKPVSGKKSELILRLME